MCRYSLVSYWKCCNIIEQMSQVIQLQSTVISKNGSYRRLSVRRSADVDGGRRRDHNWARPILYVGVVSRLRPNYIEI